MASDVFLADNLAQDPVDEIDRSFVTGFWLFLSAEFLREKVKRGLEEIVAQIGGCIDEKAGLVVSFPVCC